MRVGVDVCNFTGWRDWRRRKIWFDCAGVCVVGQRQADVQGVELDRVAVAVEVLL